MRPAPLLPILAVTFLASLGTGVMWNGIAFVAKQELGWSERRNFALLAATALVYTLAAWKAGWLAAAVGRALSPRALMALALAATGLACAPMAFAATEPRLWLAALVASAGSAILWPLVESEVAGGRHGAAMRRALGWWNVTWTCAVPIAMVLMAPLLAAGSARLAVAALAPLHALALVALAWVPARPAPHDPEEAAAEMTEAYPALLRSVRALLPLSYVLVGALSPLMPYRLADLDVDLRWQTPIAAIWTVGRIAALVALWRTSFWHGRWSTLSVGGLMLVGGFGLVVLAPSLAGLALGLIAFGLGMGVIYSTAIYYAMSVGHAEVEAGGTHEALIGAGYAVGPAVGIVAFTLAEGRSAAFLLVAGTALAALLALGAALHAWRSWRR